MLKLSKIHVMDHSFEEHLYSLDQLCRICGEKNITYKERAKKINLTLCESKKTYISCVYGLDIENDSFGKHSKYLCSKCVRKIYRNKNSNSRISIDDNVESMWCDYDKEKDTMGGVSLKVNIHACSFNKTSLSSHFYHQ